MKSEKKRTDMIAALREVGTYQRAAAMCGCDAKTIKRALSRLSGDEGPPLARRGPPTTTWSRCRDGMACRHRRAGEITSASSASSTPRARAQPWARSRGVRSTARATASPPCRLHAARRRARQCGVGLSPTLRVQPSLASWDSASKIPARMHSRPGREPAKPRTHRRKDVWHPATAKPSSVART